MYTHPTACCSLGLLQVGIKSQVSPGSVQLSLFLGNKHGEALQQLVLVVPPSPAFAFELGPVPPVLEPRKQVGGWLAGWLAADAGGGVVRDGVGSSCRKGAQAECRESAVLVCVWCVC